MKDQESRFAEHVRKHLHDPGWALPYLKAGLPADLNLNGFLSPEVFREHFYVERPNNEDLEKIINLLFEDENHNLLCIESDRGSGKSTFVQMLHLQYNPNNLYPSVHPFPCVDFSKRNPSRITIKGNRVEVTETNQYGENEIYRLFRKQYRQACKHNEWISCFYDLLKDITKQFADYPQSEGYIDILKQVYNCANEDDFDQFYKGHSQRIAFLKDADIKVLLLLFLLTIISEPTETCKRWIIVFDSIEMYVVKDAMTIAKAIDEVTKFISAAFESIGKRKDYYTRLTAIFPIRTATSLSFSQYANQSNGQNPDLWGPGNRYIVPLPRFDFASIALLKKIRYLNEIGAEGSELYDRCILLASLVMPKNFIKDWLQCKKTSDSLEFRLFTKTRLMPLFNYDFRTIMDRLYDILPKNNHNTEYKALEAIQDLTFHPGINTEYAANGENMIVARLIFDTLHDQRENLFAEIGYQDFTSNHGPGIARTIMNFLYYSELKYRYTNAALEDREGELHCVCLRDLVDKLKPFAEQQTHRLANILYKASVLTEDDSDDALVKNIWTYLIVFKKLNKKLSKDGFENLIRRYYHDVDSLNEDEKKLLECEVQLSDAGSCFVIWVSKQYEFLLSRSSKVVSTNPLFTYTFDCHLPLEHYLKTPFEMARSIILEKGINKLIDGCLEGCVYCKGKTDNDRIDCVFCFHHGHKNILDCSLFQRYQECLLTIVDNIDYLDRFRIFAFQSGIIKKTDAQMVKENNAWLLQQIAEFGHLFSLLKQKVEGQFQNKEHASNFFDKMIQMARECKSLKIDEVDNHKNTTLYYNKRLRSPRASLWYCGDNSFWDDALEYLKDNPDNRLYDVLSFPQNHFAASNPTL